MPEVDEKRMILGLGAIALMLCIVCSTMVGSSLLGVYQEEQKFHQQPALTNLIRTANTPTPVPLQRTPLDEPISDETAHLLLHTEIPIRDLRDLAIRLKYDGQDIPTTIDQDAPDYPVGTQHTFWVIDNSTPRPKQFQSEATLQYLTEHAYWWVETGMTFDQEALIRSADIFERQTYPMNRRLFGSEWRPGVDNDSRLHIFLGNVPGVGGYFASLNEYPQAVNPFSNEREMFFINLNSVRPGQDVFDSILAHEFQHMIHWYQDRNEPSWVNEGLSELAAHLNGYEVRRTHLYLRQPDLQLTTWGNSSSESLPHYASSFLFLFYLWEQFGDDFIQALVAQKRDGQAGIEATLQALGHAVTFEQIFADFVVANYLQDATLATGQFRGRWGYRGIRPRQVEIGQHHATFPIERQSTVQQYGVDYIELKADGPLILEFTGSTLAQVVNNQAHSGSYQWYSQRGDDTNTTLTRAFDLRSVSQATLQYWAWFHLEDDWDYVYLEVSTDQGRSWDILAAPHSQLENPSGNAYGPGYTGQSDGWLEEEVDLSAYAGQEILLRFEAVTDDAVNAPGFTLDDLAIPEIDFFDDMEQADPNWQAAGFVRMNNQLKQDFTLQLIDLSASPTVATAPLSEDNHITLTLGAEREAVHIVLAISAHAPMTTEAASYVYKVAK